MPPCLSRCLSLSLSLSLLVLVTAFPSAAGAQRLARPFYAEEETPALPDLPRKGKDRTPAMVSAGLLGGTVGFFVGALAGAGIERSFGCEGIEYCGLGGGFLGAMTGETTMLALGVHLANDSRGEYMAALGGSLGGLVAGWALGGLVHRSEVLLIVPVGQIVAAVAFEQRSTRAAPPGR